MKQAKTLQVGVKSVIVSPKGRILMLRTNAAFYGFKVAFWNVPGGRINVGESLTKALAREIQEEVGISRVTSIKLLKAQDIIKPELHVVRLTYISRVTSEKLVLDPKEHTDYKWVTLDELMKIKPMDPYLKAILKDKGVMSLIKDTIDRK